MTEPFDPRQHAVVPQRAFEDLQVGEKFALPSRTVTDADFAAFRVVSGDNHPVHYDVEYCRAHGHPGLLAHGLLVLCFTAAGAGTLPHAFGDSLIGFVGQSSTFHKPVYVGDSLYPALTLRELVPQRTTGLVVAATTVHNQRGELVLSGEQRYVVRLRTKRSG
jgi:acyl dehydratase